MKIQISTEMKSMGPQLYNAPNFFEIERANPKLQLRALIPGAKSPDLTDGCGPPLNTLKKLEKRFLKVGFVSTIIS